MTKENEDSEKERIALEGHISELKGFTTSAVSKMSNFATEFQTHLFKWKSRMSLASDSENPALNGLDGIILIKEYDEHDMKFTGITSDAQAILDIIPKPTKSMNELEAEIQIKNGILQEYQDVDETAETEYVEFQAAFERFEKLIDEYDTNTGKAKQKFDQAKGDLEQALLLWQEKLSRTFGDIMRKMNMNGEVIFNALGETDYVIDLRVSNSVDGALDVIEHSNISSG
nr:hypothetical protein [Candidatus Sigynarchaeota archaeon]